MSSLENWSPTDILTREAIEGRYVRLEPLTAENHGEGLYAASIGPEADERFRWLSEYPPKSREEFQRWLEKAEASTDPLFFVVVDQASGEVLGRLTFMNNHAANGDVELGNIYWGPKLMRSRGATEAVYLVARHVFDRMGYRRLTWKCNNANDPSKRAAMRFGFTFEGVFRQHMIVKGLNRDTAWFSIIDSEWPPIRAAFEAWLDPANFDADGVQNKRLEEFRQS